MAFRLAAFGHLVDLTRIESLRGVSQEDGILRIGAGTRQAAIESDPLVAEHAPLLAEATGLIGHFQIRNRGTIGGSLAHADPAAEYPAASIACDATVEVASANGNRTVSADALFESAYVTTLEPEELIVGVRVPVRVRGEGFAIREIARRSGDFALAGCAAKIVLDEREAVSDVRVVVFGVAGRPQRLPVAEQALIDVSEGELDLPAVLRSATAALEPSEDAVATARYRKSVIPHVAAEAIAAARLGARRALAPV
jgi:carbon-monoxide dehydrogenase medium subunit